MLEPMLLPKVTRPVALINKDWDLELAASIVPVNVIGAFVPVLLKVVVPAPAPLMIKFVP